MRHLFQVGGMRCASCQAHVAKAVKAVPGVQDAEVNLVTGRMTVKCEKAPDMQACRSCEGGSEKCQRKRKASH